MSYLHERLTLIKRSTELSFEIHQLRIGSRCIQPLAFLVTQVHSSASGLSQSLKNNPCKPTGTAGIVVFFSFFAYSLAQGGANVQNFEPYILVCV